MMLSSPADIMDAGIWSSQDLPDHALYPLSLSPPIRSNACVMSVWGVDYSELVIRTSSMTTELPLITYINSIN